MALRSLSPYAWFRWGALPAAIVGGCLAGIGLLCYRFQGAFLFYVVVGMAGLFFALVALRDMSLALTATVLISALVPFGIGTGTNASINMGVILVALLTGVWLVQMVVTRRVAVAPSPLNWPLLAFVCSAVLSWIAAGPAAGSLVQLPANIIAVQAGQFGLYALPAAAFLLGANHKVSERTLKLWMAFLVATGLLIMVRDTAAGWLGRTGFWNGSLYMWPVVLLVAQILFNERLGRSWKAVGWGAVALWAGWIARAALSFKGGWVPAVLAILALVGLKSWRLLAVVLVVLAIVVGAAGTDQAKAFLESEAAYGPQRPAMWLDVFRLGQRSPVFGLGLAAYTYHWQDETFESISYRYTSRYAFTRRAYAPPAHNMYADVFAQMGGLGLVCLIWVLAAGMKLGFLARRRVPSGFSGAWVHAVLAGFAALAVSSFLFADWLLPYMYNIGIPGFPQTVYTWLFLGTLVPLAARVPPEGQGG